MELSTLRQSVKNLVEKEIKPYAAAWEETGEFPLAVIKKLGELGYLTLFVPEKYSGSGFGRVETAVVLEEIGRGCMATAGYLAVTNMVAGLLAAFGNEEQKQIYLPRMAKGEVLGAFALTEPNAGSDALALESKAVSVDGGYLLSGTKIFISGGGEADLYLVFAKLIENKQDLGITCFMVEKGQGGFSFGKKEKKLGVNALPARELIFEEVFIPKTNVLGQIGKGFKYAMYALDGGRINIGAISTGVACAAYEEAFQYAQIRKQFNQPLINFQAIAFMLADMHINIEAARMLVFKAAKTLDEKGQATLEAAVAKTFATDMAVKVTNDAVQILGGYGYTKEFNVERYFRQAKLGQIIEGTNQIQRLVIARELVKRMGGE